MELFADTDALKLFVPVMGSFDFADVKPDIGRAATRWIIPITGQEQYTALLDYYNDEGYDADAEDETNNLLKKVQAPLAQLAFFLYAPKGNVNVGASGIQQTHSENSKPAFQWAADSMLQSYFDGGMEGLDVLLDYLNDNKEDYDLWSTSAAYSRCRELFINTSKEFSEHFSINNSRRTFMAMRPILKRHNDITIKSLLGKDLWAELKEQAIDEDVTEANELLLEYIRPALAHLTIADAVTELGLKIDEFGTTVISSATTSASSQNLQARIPAPAAMTNNLHINEKMIGEQLLSDLRSFLEANANDYPHYALAEADSTTFTNDTGSGTIFI